MLSKYDEEIEGEKKKSFRLNTGGFVGGERERELQAIRESLRDQAQSLSTSALTLATEYYTPQEMVRTTFQHAWFQIQFHSWLTFIFFPSICDIRLALRRPNARSRKSERRRKYSGLMSSWLTTLETQILDPGKVFFFYSIVLMRSTAGGYGKKRK